MCLLFLVIISLYIFFILLNITGFWAGKASSVYNIGDSRYFPGLLVTQSSPADRLSATSNNRTDGIKQSDEQSYHVVVCPTSSQLTTRPNYLHVSS